MKTKILSKFTLLGIAFFFTTIVYAQHNIQWNAPNSAKEKKNLYSPDPSSQARGQKTYKTECLSCHGKEGKGDGSSAMKIKKIVADLSSENVQKQTDGELFWKISEGRSPMPLARNTLTDDQRWDIINYIRTFKKK
jgi:mono/diheme cytochrome c family protein